MAGDYGVRIGRIANGWGSGGHTGLGPGADRSKMLAATTAAQSASVASPLAVPAMAEPMAAAPAVQAVYNPAPPVKQVAKKTSGCLGVMAALVALVPALYAAVALLH